MTLSRSILAAVVILKKDVFFVLSRAWDKENILSPHEESNLRPSDSALNALPLSHRDSTVSEVYLPTLSFLSTSSHIFRPFPTRFRSRHYLALFQNLIRCKLVAMELAFKVERRKLTCTLLFISCFRIDNTAWSVRSFYTLWMKLLTFLATENAIQKVLEPTKKIN